MPAENVWVFDANPYAEHWLSYLQEEMEEKEEREAASPEEGEEPQDE